MNLESTKSITKEEGHWSCGLASIIAGLAALEGICDNT